jgi:DNA invertase Pin-like site-specific DNA recombinase
MAPDSPRRLTAVPAWLEKRPFHLAAGAFALGLAAAEHPRVAALCACAAAALALRLPADLTLAAVVAVPVLLGATVGSARLHAIDAGGGRARPGTAVAARATLLERPRRSRFGSSTVLRLETGPARGARVLARTRARGWPRGGEPGTQIEVAGELTAPRGESSGGLDWRAHLRRQGIGTELRIDDMRPAGPTRGGLAGAIDRLRRRGERALDSGMGSEQAAVARGMVLGEDERIDPLLRDDFRRSGLAHVLIHYHMPITMKLDGYIRVSSVRGREGESFISPDVQREQIATWARLRNVKIAAWHTDLDQTGGKLSRPGLDKALARIHSGKTGGIAVARLDRFSRAGVARALDVVEEIHDAGGELAAVDLGIDPTTPFGEFATTLMLSLARMQRRQIGDTWKEAQRRAVERGVHVASRAPTGYRRRKDRRLEPHPDHSSHIGEIFRMKADGASWKDMALYLRAHNVESPYGTTHWQPRALSHVIENRAYLGEARSGEFVKVGAHPELVDEKTFKAAQEAKGQRSINSMGGALLAGILRCDGCGYVLKADQMRSRKGDKLRLYRCRTERSSGRCPAPASVLGSVVEPFITEAFFGYVAGMRAEGTLIGEELRAAEKKLAQAERELLTYLTAVGAADVGAQGFKAGAKLRRDAVDRAGEHVDKARERAGIADLPLAVDLMDQWPTLSVQERNRLLRAGVEAVLLRRGRTSIDKRTTLIMRGCGDLPTGFERKADGDMKVDFTVVAEQTRRVNTSTGEELENVMRERHPAASWQAQSWRDETEEETDA